MCVHSPTKRQTMEGISKSEELRELWQDLPQTEQEKRKLQIRKLIRRMETPKTWPYKWIGHDVVQFYSIFNVLRDDRILSHPELYRFLWMVIRTLYPCPEMKYFSRFNK